MGYRKDTQHSLIVVFRFSSTWGASADRFDGGADTDTITDFKPSGGDTRPNVP
jgi:hypothetical protein